MGIRQEKQAVALVLSLFAVLGVLYNIVTPIFEGYDENWHYAFVHYVAEGRGLPRQPADRYPHLAEQEASQPPLYYLLAAAATAWIPTDDFTTYLHPNPQFIPEPLGYQNNQNRFVHTPAEDFPYHGTALAVHLARLLSLAFGLGTVYLTYGLALALFPEEPTLARAAMIVTALTPGFLFSSALVSNDTLVVFLSTLALLLMARLWNSSLSNQRLVTLGLVLGCAALAKLSGLFLWPLAALLLAGIAWHRRIGWGLLKAALITFGAATLVCGWWFARNWLLYGDPTGMNMMMAILGHRQPGFGLRDVLAEFEGARWSYWAVFGWFNVSIASWLYRLYDLLSLAGIAGLCVYVMRNVKQRHWDDLFRSAFLSVWLGLLVLAFIRYTLMTIASQGRLLYPAIAALSILLARGWLALIPNHLRFRRGLIAATGAGLLAMAVYAPLFAIAPSYARPARLTEAQASTQMSQPVTAHFSEGIVLLGYSLDHQQIAPGELMWLTVCWKGEQAVREDYRVFAQLLAEHDLIAAQVDTYPGLGNFPTSQWPAGVVFCERYPLQVQDSVPSPGQTKLSIGLYRQNGERLQVTPAGARTASDNLRLVGPAIVFREGHRQLAYEWGHRLALDNYRLQTTAIYPGGSFTISLDWRALARMPVDYVATVQILDASGTMIGQSDAPLNLQGQGTSAWKPGTTIADSRTIQISPQATPGVYEIKVAVYAPPANQRLMVYDNHQSMPVGGLLPLWGLRVLPQTS